MHFVINVMTNGRRFGVLNMIDDYNRKDVAMGIDTLIPAERVIRIMEKVALCYSKSKSIKIDIDPDFIADAFKSWCIGNNINLNISSQANQRKIASLRTLMLAT